LRYLSQQPYLTLVLPNLLFTAAIFFALPAITRQMVPNYVGGVVLLLGYLMGGQLLNDLTDKHTGALLDPFGLRRDPSADAVLVDRGQERALRAALRRARDEPAPSGSFSDSPSSPSPTRDSGSRTLRPTEGQVDPNAPSTETIDPALEPVRTVALPAAARAFRCTRAA